MNRTTINERIRDATREVAEAFDIPINRVELVVEGLKRKALEEAFGDDPRSPIADALALELRQDVLKGLEKLRREEPRTTPVVDFPSQVRLGAG